MKALVAFLIALSPCLPTFAQTPQQVSPLTGTAHRFASALMVSSVDQARSEATRRKVLVLSSSQTAAGLSAVITCYPMVTGGAYMDISFQNVNGDELDKGYISFATPAACNSLYERLRVQPLSAEFAIGERRGPRNSWLAVEIRL